SPSTDMKQYMDDYKKLESSLFVKEIPNLKFTDADGETFMVNGSHTGIMSIYPESGDAVDQTRSANFIITNSGIRFMEPFEYVNAAGEEKEISEFKFVGNHSLALVDAENAVLTAGSFEEILMRNTRNWRIDLKSFEGSFKTTMDEFVEELKTLYNYKSANVREMSFDYDGAKSSYVLRLYLRISSKGNETDRFLTLFSDSGNGIKVNIGEATDNSSSLALNAYTKLQQLFNQINSAQFSYSTECDCAPKNIVLSSGDGSFLMTAI
ncbi:MAG: DUF4302 domain-containing protein, partial [Muribaculaceae bacterium]|nr:DUF4302 domain-containing protein [Muribaculaceae bacterium]